jgi:hypothetical protein
MKNHGGTRAAVLTFSLTVCYTGEERKKIKNTVEKRRVQAVCKSPKGDRKVTRMGAPDQFIQPRNANGKPQ